MINFRPLVAEDQGQLWHWFHIALWDPPPAGLRPKSILQDPNVRIYVEDWGRSDDVGVVAVLDGQDIGQLVETEIDGVGRLCFCYVADPEGNIIELQKWG